MIRLGAKRAAAGGLGLETLLLMFDLIGLWLLMIWVAQHDRRSDPGRTGLFRYIVKDPLPPSAQPQGRPRFARIDPRQTGGWRRDA